MNKTAKKKRILIVAGILVAAVALFCLVFALYKSEAQYVKNEKGEAYLKKDGQPIIYYEDLFGNTFSLENGMRVYAAFPTMIETGKYDSNGKLITAEPTSDEASSTEANSATQD